MAKKDKAEEPSRDQTKFEKKVGISTDSLRKIFEKPLSERKDGDPVLKFINLLRDRNLDGRRMGLRNWRIHAAIDEAWDAPRKQISPTLIGRIMSNDKRLTASEILKELEAWGLSDTTLFRTQVSQEGGKTVEKKILNEETFNTVLIPVVKAYVTVRAAKIYNDRNKYPLFTFDPVRSNEESEAIGEIITAMQQIQTEQYGYSTILRGAILQTLKYGQCLMFPTEAWSYDEDETASGETFTKREGIRYTIPHPTRCAIDQMYRPSTINTNTGCEWALYWDIVRYGDIEGNALYFNKDKISFGNSNNWFNDAALFTSRYFTSIYPCVGKPPVPSEPTGNKNDRETGAAFYTTNELDRVVFRTNLLVKVKPSDWGLGDYDRFLWLRVVMANDDTVIWAEPIPYTPILWAGYDADENLAAQSSMALECLPWQDLTGNILSQHLLTIRQNHWKCIVFDSDQTSHEDIANIAQKAKDSIGIHWWGKSFRDSIIRQQDPTKAMVPLTFGQQDANMTISTLNTVFSIMERVLQMSAQETGTVAGHIQTAEEVRLVSDNVSNRVQFTASFIDDFINAWKVQLVEASQAFKDDEFTVQVAKLDPVLVKKLKDDYGFEMSEPYDGKVTIKGDKSKLAVQAWVSSREGNTLRNHPQVATILLQTLQSVVQNPQLAQQVGVEWIVETINRAAKLAGAPEDFKVKVSPESSTLAMLQQVQAQLMEAAKAITDAAAQQAAAQATQDVAEQVAPVMQRASEQLQQTQELAVQGAKDNQVQQEVIVGQANALEELKKAVLQINAIIGMAAAQEQQAMPPTQEPPPAGAPPMMPV